GGYVQAEDAEEVLEVMRPAVRDRRGADGVLQDQIPADDPGEDLAERRVRVDVRRAGDRDHRGELRVAERGEDAGRARHEEGDDDGRAGDVVRGDAREHEDAGADDGADAEARERDGTEGAPEALVAVRFGEKLGERLLLEESDGIAPAAGAAPVKQKSGRAPP